jgi:hypothetical protein
MIELHIPESLAEVITQNKDELVLSIEDVSTLSHLVDLAIDGRLMGEISPTYLLGLTYFPGTAKETKHIHALGVHKSQQCFYLTSRIVGISKDSFQLKTSSGSIYQISDIKTSEPPQNLILHLCHTLHFWRIGKHFGILEVFF